MIFSLHRSVRAFLSIFVMGMILFQASPQGATGTLMPSPYQTVFDTNGNPVSGAKICTYLAGTTTQTATWTDVGLTVQNANPIRADSAGRFVVYLLPGASYKFVYQDATGTAGVCDGVAIKTVDNVSAVPPVAGNLDITGTAGEALTAGQVVYLSDGSGGKTAGQWFKADNANTYSSTLPPLGMVPASIASGAAGTIRIAGSVTGLSSLVIGGPYFVGTGGALTATQPINGRRVGNADTTSSLVLVASPLGFAPAQSTVTTTGTIVLLSLPVSFSNTFVVYMNNATLATIQGMTAGVVGQRVTIFSTGAGQVDLVNLSGAAAAGTKLLNQAQFGNTSLAPGVGSAEFIYDSSSEWRLINHDQGAWIQATFAAGNFTGNGGGTPMTWTLTSPDMVMLKYWLRGRSLVVAFQFDTTTVGGTLNTTLQVSNAAWGGYSASSTGFFNALAVASDAGTAFLAYANTVSSSVIGFLKSSGANWSAATDTTYIRGQITFEVS